MIEEKVGDIIYSHIEITDGSYHKKYIFKQAPWKYKEFTRLEDLRKYINTIKKDLIGKTLDKVLFLDDLDNNIYIFKGDIIMDNGYRLSLETALMTGYMSLSEEKPYESENKGIK